MYSRTAIHWIAVREYINGTKPRLSAETSQQQKLSELEEKDDLMRRSVESLRGQCDLFQAQHQSSIAHFSVLRQDIAELQRAHRSQIQINAQSLRLFSPPKATHHGQKEGRKAAHDHCMIRRG